MDRLYVNVFTADPTCQYFIRNITNVFGFLMDPYNGSVCGSYMDLYVDLIWVVYMLMCSQLIQNVNISFEICANLSGGVWRSFIDPYKIPHTGRSLY